MAEIKCNFSQNCKFYNTNNCKLDAIPPEVCIKLQRMNSLYNNSLLSLKQQEKVEIRAQQGSLDIDLYKRLSKLDIYQEIKSGTNIYFHSYICGNGKTMWATELMKRYFEKIWWRSPRECAGLFINVPRFFIALKSKIDRPDSLDGQYINHIQDNILDADIVIWDEVGAKGLTDFEHENLLNYIDARLDAGKSNFYTSNLSGEELRLCIGDRLYSRIINNSINIEFRDADKRGLMI